MIYDFFGALPAFRKASFCSRNRFAAAASASANSNAFFALSLMVIG